MTKAPLAAIGRAREAHERSKGLQHESSRLQRKVAQGKRATWHISTHPISITGQTEDAKGVAKREIQGLRYSR
jgi:hypothetical protein